MHIALSASLYQLVAASLRQRLAMCSRILIGQAVFWVCFVSWTANFAAAQDGADVNERFRQATAAMREGHLDDAGEGFAAIVKETPNFAEAHLNLGLVLQEQNRFEQARASFQRALTLKPKLRGANLFLGVALFRLNHLDQAVVAIQKETTAYPKDPAAWMWLGVVRLAQEMPEEAAEALDKAAKLAPDDVDILYHRGHAHLLVSKNSYGRLLKIDPNNALAKYKLGVLTVEQGDGPKGKELIEAALREKPGLLHVDYNLGRAEMLLGNDAAAAQRLERATSAPGSDPEVVRQAWYQLGIVYRRLHRMEDAHKALATFQKLKDAEAENSQKILKRLEAKQNPDLAQPP